MSNPIHTQGNGRQLVAGELVAVVVVAAAHCCRSVVAGRGSRVVIVVVAVAETHWTDRPNCNSYEGDNRESDFAAPEGPMYRVYNIKYPKIALYSSGNLINFFIS